MRVLFATNMYPLPARPSYGIFVKRQADAIRARGHELEAFFINGSTTALMYLTGCHRLARVTQRFKPDVIHAHYGITGFIAAFPRNPVPLVLSLCGDDVLGAPRRGGGITFKSRVIRAMTRAACGRADQLIVKSDEMARIVESWGVATPHVIPNGVDVDFFSPPNSRADVLSARQRLGLDPQRKYILFPSHAWEHRKRIDLAQEVASRVKRAGVDVMLLPVYHQPQALVADYLRACDLMILTSEWEGSPNVVKEAMAAALPSVSFDVGDVAWLCSGTEFHRVVPRHDVDGMTREVLDLLSRAGQRGDGRDRIVEILTSEQVARQIESVYRQALSSRSGNGSRYRPRRC
jgi:teichuronic acid biosynthesis glycosyltransferase TuaC